MINVEQRLKEAFPSRNFTLKTSLKVYTNDVDFYNSFEFIDFLDKLSKEMTFEEYMNTDFYINEYD